MAIQKIVRIVEPHKNDRNFHGGLYQVYTEQLGDQYWDMFKAEVDLLKFENEMLQAGISEEMIEKHRDLVIEHVQDEISIDGESE